MILLELFTGLHQVRDLDDEEIESALVSQGMGDSGDIVRAYEYQHDDKRIMIWFMNLGRGRYECSFGLRSMNPYDYPFNFKPTGTGNEFKVYGAVAQCIREFIADFQPNVVTMVGYDERQTNLYRKAVRRVLLPAGYQFEVQGKGAEIVKVAE